MRVSVITAVRNGVSTLGATIQSVLDQSHQDIEYIIVDGASTDGTVDLIRSYESHLARWISEPDQGIYDAMNKGIALATGDLIGILNADDRYLPGSVGTMATTAVSTGADVLYGDIVSLHSRRGAYRIASKSSLQLGDFWHMPVLHPSVFARLKVYQRFGVFDPRYRVAGDFELMLRFFRQGARFHYLPMAIAEMSVGGVSYVRYDAALVEVQQILRSELGNSPVETYVKGRACAQRHLFTAITELRNWSLSEHIIDWYRQMRRRLGDRTA